MPKVAQLDNWSDADNRLCLELLERILAVANLFGYGEIHEPGYASSLMAVFQQVKDPRFIPAVITDKTEVYPALQKWFGRGEREGAPN